MSHQQYCSFNSSFYRLSLAASVGRVSASNSRNNSFAEKCSSLATVANHCEFYKHYYWSGVKLPQICEIPDLDSCFRDHRVANAFFSSLQIPLHQLQSSDFCRRPDIVSGDDRAAVQIRGKESRIYGGSIVPVRNARSFSVR